MMLNLNGSTRTSILEILRNANSSVSVLRSCGSPLGHLFARGAHEHASGMELRTGDTNQRHGEILCATLIAHNVNNFHQAEGVGLG